MIKLIIKNFSKETKDKIKEKIEQKIKNLDDEVIVDWFHISDYYKSPDEKKCVLSLIFQKNIKIIELISFFKCKWAYEKDSILDESNNTVEEEEAIWSKLCNPNQIFIDPKVQWVHMYNWE